MYNLINNSESNGILLNDRMYLSERMIRVAGWNFSRLIDRCPAELAEIAPQIMKSYKKWLAS